MAVRASELLLIIRAQNQASSALRRLGSDLQTLGKGSTLKRAQQQLAVNEQNLLRQRMAAQRQLDSIQESSGVRNLANQQRMAAVERNRQALVTRGLQLQKRGNDLANARVAADSRLNDLAAQQASNLARQQAQMQRLAAAEAEFMAAQKRAASVTWASGTNKGRIATPIAAEQLANAEINYETQKAALAKLVAQQEKYAASIVHVQNRVAGFAERQAILTRNSEALTKAQNDVALSAEKVDAMWRKEQAIAAELSAELTVVARKLAIIRNDQRALAEEMRAARWTPLVTLGSIMEHTARVVTQSGLVIGAAFAYAAHSAAQFQTQAGLAATQVADKFGKGARGTVTAQKQIADGILSIMKAGQAIAGSQEQNAAAYDIFSSMTLKGSQATQIKTGISLLKLFNKAAIAGQADLQSVTHAGITILNNFGQQGKQASEMPKFLNRMFASVRFGRTTVNEFVSSLGQVAPAFSGAFGANAKSFDQLAGAMAVVTRYIPKVGMASSGLQRIVQIFGRPDFAAGFQKLFNFNLAPGGHLLPFDQIIAAINKYDPLLKKGGENLQNFFKTITGAASKSGHGGTNATIQANRALQVLITHISDYGKISKKVTTDNNEFWKSFRTEQATPGVRWKEFTQELHALVIEIGSYAIPAFIKLGEPLARAVKWFDNLSESTKKQIATWGTYGAAIMLAAGAFLFLFGAVFKLVGLFGKLRITGPMVVASFVAFNIIVGVLKGNIHSLGDVVNSVLNSLTPHSSWEWVTYLSVAALAANRLAKGFMAVRDAYVATTAASATGVAAGGIGGLAGGLTNFARTANELRQVRQAEGANVLLASFQGTAAAAGGLSMSIPIIAGGVALAAGAALLWSKHMSDVAAKTKEVADIQKRNATLFNKPFGDLSSFGKLPGSLADTVKAKTALDGYVKAYKDAVATFKKAPTEVNRNAMMSAAVDVAGAQDVLAAANKRSNTAFDKLSQSIYAYGHSVHTLEGQKSLLRDLQDQLTALQSHPTNAGIFTGRSQQEIATLIDHIKILKKVIADSVLTTAGFGNKFRSEFAKVIDETSRMKFIPAISPQFTPMLEQVAAKMKRMLSAKEITLLVNAMVDPKVANDLPRGLRAIFNRVERQMSAQAGQQSILIKPKVKTVFDVSDATKAFDKNNPFAPGGKFSALGIFKKSLGAAATITIKSKLQAPDSNPALKKINDFFSKTPPHTTVAVKPPPPDALAVIGAQISAGIHGGMKVLKQEVDVYIKNLTTVFKHKIESHSPSKLFAREIGVPLGQGIAHGLLSTTDLIKSAVTKQVTDVISYIRSQNLVTKTAALTMNLFGGSFLTKRTSAIDSFDPTSAKQKLAEADSLAAQIKKMEAKLGSAASTKFTVGRPTGMLKRGNIDLNARPVVKNKDGSVSTVKSVSFSQDGKEILVPEVVGKKVVSAIEAWKHYLKTGQNLGTFKSVADANAYAISLHNEQAAYAKTTTAAKNYAASRIQLDKLREAADRKAAIKPPPLTSRDLIKDTQNQVKQYTQFNKDINTLAKRGASPALLDQLRALGIDGLKYLNVLVKGGKPALKELSTAFDQLTKQINKSKYVTLDDLKNMNAAMKEQLRSMASTAAQTMLDTWNGFHDQMQSAFGDLFGGPDNLSNMIGDSLKSAQDQYTSDAQALTDQIAADNKQLADLTQQNTQQAIAQMQQSFGQLFSGDWMQGTQVQTLKQFGQKIGFSDLLKDLQGQTDKFERWQNDLKALAKKLPKGLQQALKDLGPDAVDQLDALNGATKDQLAQYIKLWQKGQKDIGKAAKGLLNSSDFQSQTASILSDLKSVTDQLNKLVVPHALTPGDVIDDLQKQSDAFSSYQDTIKQLQAKGLPDQLIQQLQALGPQGLDYLKALNSMTSNQLSKYVGIWTKAQGQITDATNTMFQTQLQMWQKYGANIGAAIIAGVATDQQSLIDYFTHLFQDLLNGVTPPPPPSSDSGGQSSGGGSNTDEGNKRGQSGTRAPSAAKHGSFVNNNTSTVINQTIHAYESDDLMSLLSKANFRITTVLPNS